MEVDLENIDLKKEFKRNVAKKTSNKLVVIVNIFILLTMLGTIKAYAVLTNTQYDQITNGEIFYKNIEGGYSKSMALDTKVSMEITGVINRVKVKQTFKNPDNYWTEGTYLFPLPENAAVDGLKMIIGQSIIVGEIKEKVEAKKIYEQAKKEGKKATLVEQNRPNLFTANVANIPPLGEITIEIEYQQKVSYDNEEFAVTFPMVAPQKFLQTKPDGTLKNKANKNLVQAVENKNNLVQRPVDIDVSLKAGFEINKIESPYHKINTKSIDKETVKIYLENTIQANRDFKLTWKAKKNNDVQAKVYTQKVNGRDFGLLMITPPNELYKSQDTQNREVIFIIDSSGSMSGTSINQATLALEMAINRLKKGDKFNIIDYDTNYNPLFKTAQPVNNFTSVLAKKFIDNIKADGGTQALEPIKYALESLNEDSNEYLRQVIFITDGQLGNEQTIFKTVKSNLKSSKMFTIAIGSAPNSFFMKKLAKFGRGTFAHIGNQKEVTKQMNIFFRKIENPSITDINIDGIGLEVSDLYYGESVYYSFEAKEIPNKLILKGKNFKGVFEKELTLSNAGLASGIDKLWAKESIDKLMNAYYIEYDSGKKDIIKSYVTSIGLSHGLVTNFTSLIAVDKTPSNIQKQINKTKQVQTKIPKGWKLYDANIPQTATNSELLLLIGGLLVLLGVMFYKLEESTNEEV